MVEGRSKQACKLMAMNYNQLGDCVKAGLIVPFDSGKAVYLSDGERFCKHPVKAAA